jgi:hypothetical protein
MIEIFEVFGEHGAVEFGAEAAVEAEDLVEVEGLEDEVFAHELLDDFNERGIIGGMGWFVFDEQAAGRGHGFDDFVEGGDVEETELGEGVRGDGAVAGRGALEGVIVNDDGLVVGGEVDVAFAPLDAFGPGVAESGEGVLGELVVEAAMGDEDGHNLKTRMTKPEARKNDE